jgi:hypothetical protein
MEYMSFFLEGLNPFKILARFKWEFTSEFYNSKSSEIWELDQKGISFYLEYSATMPSLENFGQKESCVLYFQVWKVFKYLEKNLGLIRQVFESVNERGPLQQSGPATYLALTQWDAHPAHRSTPAREALPAVSLLAPASNAKSPPNRVLHAMSPPDAEAECRHCSDRTATACLSVALIRSSMASTREDIFSPPPFRIAIIIDRSPLLFAARAPSRIAALCSSPRCAECHRRGGRPVHLGESSLEPVFEPAAAAKLPRSASTTAGNSDLRLDPPSPPRGSQQPGAPRRPLKPQPPPLDWLLTGATLGPKPRCRGQPPRVSLLLIRWPKWIAHLSSSL